MSVVEVKIDDSLPALTKRLARKNTKDRLAYQMAKFIKVLQDQEITEQNKELWEVANRVVW